MHPRSAQHFARSLAIAIAFGASAVAHAAPPDTDAGVQPSTAAPVTAPPTPTAAHQGVSTPAAPPAAASEPTRASRPAAPLPAAPVAHAPAATPAAPVLHARTPPATVGMPVAAAPAPAAPAAPVVPIYRLPPPRLMPLRVAEPPRPRRYGNAGAPFAVGVGGAVRFRDDVGYRALGGKKRQGELDVFASYDIYQPVRPLVLAAGLNYRFSRVGDRDALEVASHTVHADLTLRYTPARWLFPHVRAGLGLSTVLAHFSDDSGDLRAHDRSSALSGAVGGGFTLRTPRRLFETRNGRLSSFSLGLLVEGGYLFARAAPFQVTPRENADVDQQPVRLGKLNQGGAYLRVLAVARF